MNKNRIKQFGACLLGLLLTACGAGGQQDEFTLLPVEQQAQTVSAEETLAAEDKAVFVYICGEVVSPGVYEVPAGSRIWDVLLLAGGFTEDAARDAINLAEKAEDGMQITVPSAAQEEARKAARERQEAGLLNLNTASKEQLCTIPGIGETRAEAILRYREEKGGFASVEEIMQVDGIKEGLYAKIQDKIYVE